MYYNSFKDYINANTKGAYRVAKRLPENQREKITSTLDFLVHKLEEDQKIMKWQEDAVKEITTKEQYEQIMQMYSVYMHNDFLTTEIGKKMLKEGYMKPASIRLFARFKSEEE